MPDYNIPEDEILFVEDQKEDYSKVGEDKSSDCISNSELNFKYQLIKGRIAENIIQELFLSEGYPVYKFGIENSLPALLQKIQKKETPQSLSLRIAPDLIINDPESFDTYYAEVKFRANGIFTLHYKIDIDIYSKAYPNTLFYIITQEDIFEVPFAVFEEGRTLNLNTERNKDRFRLEESSNFSLRTQTILKFKDLAEYFFKDLPACS